MDEYKSWEQETILGASITINAPLGSYDKDSRFNLGGNRWVFKPELAISHQINTSKVFVEAYLNHEFYTKNEQYLGKVREESGKTGIDTHLIYEFMRGAFVSLDYFHVQGGEVKDDNVLKTEAINDTTVGASLKVSFSLNTAVEVKYRDQLTSNDGSDKKTFDLKLQYLW